MKREVSNLFLSETSPSSFVMSNSPVIENLATHDMTANPPTVLITLVAKPVVAQDLGVKVVCFERRVVHMRLGALEEEEAVVINLDEAAVEMQECGSIPPILVVNQLLRSYQTLPRQHRLVEKDTYITGLEVEPGCVKHKGLCKVRHAHSEMP